MNQIEFNNVVASIKAQQQKYATEYAVPESGAQCYNIDKVLETFYSLVDRSGYLIDSSNSSLLQLPSDQKFVMRGEYPDESIASKTIITYDILRREPASLASNKEAFQGTKQFRPFYIGDRRDGVHNERVIDLALMYDNLVEFIAWSPKISQARSLATLFEQLFHKFYWDMRKITHVFIYQGRSDNRLTTDVSAVRYYGIPMHVFIRTVEKFELRESEITGFDIQVTASD